MRRFLRSSTVAVALALAAAAPALACGGLIGPNGTVNLLRTTTLAAYVDGVEHYVTSFSFAGEPGARFGSIVPLPGIPTDVRKGGAWTLQRLQQETAARVAFAALTDADAATAREARVVLETTVDALDVTVLEGGARAVGRWALDEGFRLPPDAPEVLEFYARRSPVFMAVRFNAARTEERGLQTGDGIPVHVTIPVDDPWVPLRILALGKQPSETVGADVYLLTERRPALLPNPGRARTLDLATSETASRTLLRDLRSDRGMGWLPPAGMWLSHVVVDARAGRLTHDLAIDAGGGR
ncbi:MAG TPA: DUF2330 domain-containing protein, partial [Actinomycetota bacterium]|nr:DUF2330 domain-containing protein [Actinomycetota bacterium]